MRIGASLTAALMIRTIADMLRALAERESVLIEGARIRHAPTIGSMYERLTTQLLEYVLPEGAELSLVAGFAEDTTGKLSGQIDCMLVSGSGTPVPHTDLFKWPVKDVIAVFEVKKRLFSAGLAESHSQLLGVLHLHWDEVLRNPGGKIDIEPSLHAFKQIVGFPAPPREDLEQLPFDIEMIYRFLTVEQVSPLRIAFGYSGYKSEFALRSGFVRFLNANIGVPGFSPTMLPTLIVAGSHSLLKLNGQPYSSPRRDNWWPVFASSNENPLILVLELIWARLSQRIPMPEWYDADLGMETLSPLLACRAAKRDETMGWEYNVSYISKAALQEPTPRVEWRPHFVSVFQFTIMNVLCERDEIPLTDPLLQDLSAEESEGLNQLFELRLIGRETNNLVLLTRLCRCLITPDGRFAVGDDSSGRFSAWTRRLLLNRKQNKA
jgi:hypothetical protein